MRRHGRVIGWFGLPALALLAAAGCATRGYVRDRVAELRSDVNEAQGRNGALIAATQGRVDSVSRNLGSVRELALGRVGFREVGRQRVYFAFDRSDLQADARSALDGIANQVASNPQYVVDVYGFADPTGPEEYNFALGRRRADAVLRYLLDRTPGQLPRYESISFGELAPSAEDATLGSGKDRRQVLVLLMERVPAGTQDERDGRARDGEISAHEKD